MLSQYLKFFINGGVLGLIAMVLQALIYQAIGTSSGEAYAAASGLTYLPLIAVNFLIQRAWIFRRDGLLRRFFIASILIMLLITLLAPLCRLLITAAADGNWGDRTGFLVAALIGSVPSFWLTRRWVFPDFSRQKTGRTNRTLDIAI